MQFTRPCDIGKKKRSVPFMIKIINFDFSEIEGLGTHHIDDSPHISLEVSNSLLPQVAYNHTIYLTLL